MTGEFRDECSVLEGKIREKEALIERLKRDNLNLMEELKRRGDYLRLVEIKKREALELEAKADKLTEELRVSRERSHKKEELEGKLTEVKGKLRQVKRDAQSAVPEEPSLSENELELLEILDQTKACIEDRKRENDELEKRLARLEREEIDIDRDNLQLEQDKEAASLKLTELDEHVKAKQVFVEELKTQLTGNATPVAQSLYSEAEEGRQEVTQQAKELHSVYKAIKSEIDDVNSQIRKLEEGRLNYAMSEAKQKTAMLESAYQKTLKHYEVLESSLKNRTQWPTLEFLPNDLNTEEFELFREILEYKRRETDKWNANALRLGQEEIQLSGKVESLRYQSKELRNKLETLREERARLTKIEAPATSEIRKVHFDLPDVEWNET